MTRPQACPDETTLRDFLRDQFADADAERIDDHIGGCPACQRALDRLVGSLPGRWLPVPDGAEGDATVTHAAAVSLGVMPRVLTSAIEPDDLPRPVAPPGSPETPTAADGPARLHLLGEIARGGMGAVLKGRDVDLGRDLAVKVLLERHRDKPELVRRFVEEAQIGGQLQHPGIVPVYELGALADRRPYFAMKLVKGRTLAALLDGADRPGGRPARGSSAIFEQVCQTVAYAHARGVIHRDLKPSNVMVGALRRGAGDGLGPGQGPGRHRRRRGRRGRPGAGRSTRPRGRGRRRTDRRQRAGDARLHGRRSRPAARSRRSTSGPTCSAWGRSCARSSPAGRPTSARTRARVRRLAIEGRLEDASARLEGCGADAGAGPTWPGSAWRRTVRIARADAGEVASADGGYLAGVQERLQQERLARERQEVRAAEGRRRHRVLVAAALTVSMTLALGVVASTIFAIGERAARRKAAEEAIRATRSEQAAQRANADTIAALNDMRQAQAETKEALAQSEESRKQAEAVSGFLVEAFRSPDPTQDGRDVKVADVLDRASAARHGVRRFAGDPGDAARYSGHDLPRPGPVRSGRESAREGPRRARGRAGP